MLSALLVFVLSCDALSVNSSTPITEKVSIEGSEVYGQSAGFDDINVCKAFATSMVEDAAKPSITVCGTATKVKVFLRNRCEDYHHYLEEAGVCDSAADSSTCQTISPATQRWMSTAQSYMVSALLQGRKI